MFSRRLRGAGKQGIKSSGINQVIATAFVLRVLKENDYINTITGFEEKIEPIDDDGNKNRAFADIVENNNKIIECKSWEMNGKAFQNFVLDSETPVGSVKQFTTYLMDDEKVTAMDKIEYWFDIKKLNNNPDTTPIKEKFKQMMYNGTELTNNGTQVFNAIWGNVGLRGKLFGDEDNIDDARDNFITIISITRNSFYNFITVK